MPHPFLLGKPVSWHRSPDFGCLTAGSFYDDRHWRSTRHSQSAFFQLRGNTWFNPGLAACTERKKKFIFFADFLCIILTPSKIFTICGFRQAERLRQGFAIVLIDLQRNKRCLLPASPVSLVVLIFFFCFILCSRAIWSRILGHRKLHIF